MLWKQDFSESGFSVFFLFAGEPLAGRSAAGIPRGYWNFSWVAEDDLSFPNELTPPSGEWDIVSSPQTDRQAQAPSSSKNPLLPIGCDTWHQLSISTHKRLCLACPLPLTQVSSLNCADRDPLKASEKIAVRSFHDSGIQFFFVVLI